MSNWFHLNSTEGKFLNSKAVKILKNKFFIVGVVFLVWVIFFDSSSIITWFSDIGKVFNQERQKAYYKEAIKKTDEQLLELSSNRDSLEKFAREQYYFHKDDEDVFIVRH